MLSQDEESSSEGIAVDASTDAVEVHVKTTKSSKNATAILNDVRAKKETQVCADKVHTSTHASTEWTSARSRMCAYALTRTYTRTRTAHGARTLKAIEDVDQTHARMHAPTHPRARTRARERIRKRTHM